MSFASSLILIRRAMIESGLMDNTHKKADLTLNMNDMKVLYEGKEYDIHLFAKVVKGSKSSTDFKRSVRCIEFIEGKVAVYCGKTYEIEDFVNVSRKCATTTERIKYFHEREKQFIEERLTGHPA